MCVPDSASFVVGVDLLKQAYRYLSAPKHSCLNDTKVSRLWSCNGSLQPTAAKCSSIALSRVEKADQSFCSILDAVLEFIEAPLRIRRVSNSVDIVRNATETHALNIDALCLDL